MNHNSMQAMNRISHFSKLLSAVLILLFCLNFTAPFSSTSAFGQESVNVDVDWPAFLSRHDMVWDRLPGGWKEAPHFGNALIGSMIYQQENTIVLQLFRADVQDHRDNRYGWTAYSRPRLRIGSLHLDTVGEIQGGELHLDLWNAELTGTIHTDRGKIDLRHFVHARDMAIVTELNTSGAESGSTWSWHPQPPRTTRSGYPETKEEINDFANKYGEHYRDKLKLWKPNPDGQKLTKGDVTVWQQNLLAGGQYSTAWTETRSNGGDRTLYVSIGNSYPERTATTSAVSSVRDARRTDMKKLVQTHRSWWHDYYPRSFITLPDTRLETLYWNSIYRYGSNARRGRAFLDVSGLWFQGGGWPYVTNDWNTQSAHWAPPAANRLEQSGELLASLYRARDTLRRNVRPRSWQEDSAYLHITTAMDWIGPRNQDKRYTELIGALPWLLHNCWWQYRFSMDDELLREKLYPLLRRSVNMYLHMLEEENGELHLPPTYSPETHIVKDANFDLSLLRWGCRALLWSSKRLGIDDPLIPRWKAVLNKLTDFPTDKNGFRLGADRTASKGHRHGSHLLMIYPLYVKNIDQPGTDEVLNRSVERFQTGLSGYTAMVATHLVPMAGAIGRSDMALKGLKAQLNDLHPNGLWFGVPLIESTVSAANNVQSMLLQSWGELFSPHGSVIRVFPATPEQWGDVRFHNLRAQGAFLVSAARENGETQFIRVKSLAGEPCRLKTDMDAPLEVVKGPEVDLTNIGNNLYELDLSKGESVVIMPEGASREATISPLPPEKGKMNSFGLPD